MAQNNLQNRQILLASRPHGRPQLDNFRLHHTTIPEPQEGEVLLRTVYLSLDPYMRGRMSEAKSYASPVTLGEVMCGGTVCQIVKSRHSLFSEGDWVTAYIGWQDYAVSDGSGLLKLPKDIKHPSYSLGILGMPGFTAYMGLLDIGKPKVGETVVVAAATGPVGGTVGQIAKIKGSRAVGIAGNAEKCHYAETDLGFDICLDHTSPNFAEQLRNACPDGIDIYYENVGGKIFDAALPLLNTAARIPLCGLISQYNSTTLPVGQDRLPLLLDTVLRKRLTIKGFIIFDDYGPEFPEFITQMTEWLAQGKVHYREQITTDLENAPQTFIDLLDGKNFGKVVIQV